MDSDTIVKLKSTTDEERVFEVTLEEGDISELIRNTTRTKDSEETEIEIEIAQVKCECLTKVVEFMKHYKEDKMKEIPSPLDRLTFNEIMDQEWYQKFVSEENVDRDLLFELLTAANFMGIKPLLNLTCLKVTFLLADKSAEELREILKLPELTAEEEAEVR